MISKVNIGIVDDQSIFCNSLKLFLNQRENIEVILTANSGDELFKKLSSQTIIPDILLLDIDMPEMDGISLLHIIKKSYPALRVIMLSFHSELIIIEKAIKSGASGYVRKGGAINDIFEAIHKVSNYNFFLDNEVIEELDRNQNQLRLEQEQDTFPSLSERELQVLKLICKEKATKQIADILKTSVKSIEYNRACLLKKTNSESLVGLVYYAIKNNLDE